MRRTQDPALWPACGRGSWPTTWLALALCLLAAPVQAQYKWKDARGQLHASDLPPPADIPERLILQRPAGQRAGAQPTPAARPAAPTTTSTGTRTAAAEARAGNPANPRTPQAQAGAQTGAEDAELARRRQKAEAERQAQASAEAQRQAALRAQNCERARQQLAQLQSGQRLQRISASGERVPLDDATREADAALARQVMASDCR